MKPARRYFRTRPANETPEQAKERRRAEEKRKAPPGCTWWRDQIRKSQSE